MIICNTKNNNNKKEEEEKEEKKGKEEEEKEEKKEKEEEKFLRTDGRAGGRVDQTKVVQEVLADLKIVC